jgi:hypothetical protein
MTDVTKEIETYRAQFGKLPASLADLGLEKKERFHLDGEDEPVDAWNRPLHYEIKGDSYDLYSLGRDGHPGGFGLDADLYAGKSNPETERLPLGQFASAYGNEGIKVVCILAGVLAFPICLLGVKNRAKDHFSWVTLLGNLGLTAFFAVMAAVAICVLHLPTGH